MSWLDPNFKYVPAAAHNDVRAFHRRQRERAARIRKLAEEARPAVVAHLKRVAK